MSDLIQFDMNKPMNRNAFHEGHSDEERIEWIWQVSHMTTINSVTKDELQTALRWFVERMIVQD